MVLITILFVLLAIIGSWLWLKPTPEEKHSARLRQQAFSLGLKVRMLSPGSLSRQVCYFKSIKSVEREVHTAGLVGKLVRDGDELTWQHQFENGISYANKLLDVEKFMSRNNDVMSVEMTHLEVNFIWTEQGEGVVIEEFLLLVE